MHYSLSTDGNLFTFDYVMDEDEMGNVL